MLLPFAEAEQLVKTHHCSVCRHKATLVARTVPGDLRRLDVVCGGCGSDEHLQRDKSFTQRWRENPDSVPVHTANKLANKHHTEIEAVAEGLPPELAEVVRGRYFGLPSKREE